MMWNTNNGTERLNEDLKYDELVKYKNCTLSELLQVLIENFIPKQFHVSSERNESLSQEIKYEVYFGDESN